MKLQRADVGSIRGKKVTVVCLLHNWRYPVKPNCAAVHIAPNLNQVGPMGPHLIQRAVGPCVYLYGWLSPVQP